MIIAKLVFLGLFLLPVVAFGLIFHHLVTGEKSNIIASAEDWEEVGLDNDEGVDNMFEDDPCLNILHPFATIYHPAYHDNRCNVFYIENTDFDYGDDYNDKY